MAFAGRDSPFPSGPPVSCAVSSCAQQPRADISSALLKQPCLLADALITSSGEMLSRSSSTGMLPRPHPISRAPPRSPQSGGGPGNTGRETEIGEAAPCPAGREARGQRRRLGPAAISAPQTVSDAASTPRTAPVRVFQHHGQRTGSAPRRVPGVQHRGQRPPGWVWAPRSVETCGHGQMDSHSHADTRS